MIFPSYSGNILAMDDDGSILWDFDTGWGGTQALIADITGDGKLEVLAGGGSKTWLLDAAAGTELWRLDYTLLGYAPAAVDLTGDGKLEVLFNASSNRVLAVRSDGSILWESTAMTQSSQSPVVVLGDVTGDGIPDIAVGARDSKVHVFSGESGAKVWEYAVAGRCFGVAAADINGDGIADVVATAATSGLPSYVYALSGADGSLIWRADVDGRSSYTVERSPSIADVDGDGVPDVLVAGLSGFLYALSGVDGSLIWEIPTGDPSGGAPAIVDLTGDGYMEIVVSAGKWLRVFTGLDVTIVYVDDAWVGLAHGTEVEPGKYVGGNAFGIITEGLDGVRTGGVVQVLPGTYTERLTIGKPVVVVGGDPNDRPLVDLPDGDNAGITILASNVVLEGLDIRKLDSAGWSNTIILVDRGGSWLPGYEIVHEDITFRDLLIEGGRRGMVVTAGNLTIEDCVFDGQIRDAIYLNAVSGLTTITGNTFLGAQDSKKAILFENFSSNDPGVSGIIDIIGNTSVGKNNFLVYNQWLHLDDRVALRVIGNVIREPGSTAIDIYNLNPAVNIDKLDSILVAYNSFEGIPADKYAVRNRSLDVIINAALNWWESINGPAHADNPDANGAAVSDNVIFSPWLGLDPDGDPLTPGVQITGPQLIIVAPVGPEPTTGNGNAGYLNQAIAGSNELPYTDTIEVRHGTYDASEPITDGVNMVSEPGSASHTTLNGNMTIGANNVFIGLPLQGFRVNDNITVEDLVDASSCSINWSDLYGSVTNNGTGTFNAKYNYWGTQEFAVIDARTFGDVDVYPYLPKNADESYNDIVALIDGGTVGNIDQAIEQLHFMVRQGQNVGELIRYLAAAGAGVFQALPAQARMALGRAAGGGGAIGTGAGGIYTVGDIIEDSVVLTDPVSGEPITDVAVTVSLMSEDGTLAFWGCAVYDETIGEYVYSIDTSGLAPGTYELIVQSNDGQSVAVTVEVEAA